MPDYNPETHIMCDDGKVYERKIVAAVGVASGMHVSGQAKSDLHIAIQNAMADAVELANGQGVTDPDEIRDRMIAARDRVLADD